MGSDDDIDLALAGEFGDRFLILARAKPRQQFDLDRKGGKALFERLEMLVRQHRRRRQDGDLPAVHHRLKCRSHRDLGLTVADIADYQTVHRHCRFHIIFDIRDRRRLVDRQIKGERVLKLVLPRSVGRKGVAADEFTLGVELEQLVRHVPHRTFGLSLGLLPADAA